jgi:cytochrome P450
MEIQGRSGSGPHDGGAVALADLDVNPYPAYRWMRDQGVVWVEAIDRWVVSRWADMVEVETNTAAFTAMETGSLQTRVMGRTMLRTDGAAHKRLRRAAQDPLRPAVVEQHWQPLFQQLADELVDGFAADGSADLMRDFAGPFTARCLAAILGLQGCSDEELERWSQALMDGTGNYADDPVVWERSERAAREIDAATTAALARVRAEPDASIISAMAHADGGGDPLADEEIHANVKLLIGGGLNEPRDGIGLGAWALLSHTDQLELLRAEPDRWPAATEEILRWGSPLAVFGRQVAQPVQLGGATLEPGARLAIVVASANRDEAQFPSGDTFDIRRPKTRNAAFGVGHHFCLGVWMARHQIGRVALPTLFARLPGLRLDHDHPPTLRGWVFRGPTRFPMVWDPA